MSVTIWEAASGGLFSASASDRTISAGSRTATLPEQVVTRDGAITIPYAGRIRITGMRPSQVELEIVRLLQGKAIEPQVIVTVSKALSNTATVTGEVTTGQVVPLTVKGDKLMDVIAAVGGLKVPAHESFVRLTRGNTTATIAFNAILSNPAENVYIRNQDVITVVRDPQTFTAFGSTGKNASVNFDAVGISLEEAIAKAGGLLDERADPGGVFLLRFEPTALVGQLLPGRVLPSQGNLVPVVYRLNLRQTNSFFLARAFKMQNKDMIYVSNAPSDPVDKFLRLVGTVTAPVYSAYRIGRY